MFNLKLHILKGIFDVIYSFQINQIQISIFKII